MEVLTEVQHLQLRMDYLIQAVVVAVPRTSAEQQKKLMADTAVQVL